MKTARTHQRAFSLVEVLVVIGIILLLSALLLTVFSQSKKSAYGADSLSRLRQLGAAGVLYHEERGLWPVSASDVVVAGLAPKDLLRSPRDTTPEGIAHSVAKELLAGPLESERPAQTYFESYPGHSHYGITRLQRASLERGGTAAGWLIDLTESTRKPHAPWMMCEGKYTRLTYEGSVVSRRHGVSGVDSAGASYRTAFVLFGDPTEENREFWQQ